MTSEPQLTLRPTVIAGDRLKDDFSVYFDGQRVGRIKFASERTGELGLAYQSAAADSVMVQWNGGRPGAGQGRVPGSLGAFLRVIDA